MIGCRRAMAAAGREVPLQVQVTMETTGRMLVGSEIGAAVVVDRRDAPRRARHQLRHRPGRDAGAPALPQPALAAADQRAAQRRPAEHRRRPHPLRPHARAARRVPRPPRHRARRRRRRRLLRHDARAPAPGRRGRAGTSSRRAATPSSEPSVSSIYSPVPIEQDLSFLIIGERTNANGSKAFREAMLARRLGHVHEDGQRAGPRGRPRARRLRRLRRPRRRRRHGRDRQALRHPGQRAARAGLHRDAGAGGRAAAHRRPGDPQLGQPRGRRAARQPLRPGDVAGPRLRRRRDLPADRRARPGPRRRVEDGDRPPHPRDRRRALRPVGERPDLRRPDVPAVDRRRRPAPRRHLHDRGDPADQGRDPRRPHDARRVQRQLRAQPGGPPRPQQRVPPRGRAGRPRLGDRPRRQDRAAQPACPTSSARSASTSSGTAADRTTTRCSSCSRCSPTSSRRRPRSPTAAGCRCRSACTTASSTATATASPPTSTRRWRQASRRSPSSTTCCSAG